jgi:photosystem II stability/assembly factor-like uncharacterized protein
MVCRDFKKNVNISVSTGISVCCIVFVCILFGTLKVQAQYTSENLYVSEDGGETWSVVEGRPTRFMPQRAVLASDGVMYITYGNGAGPHPHWDQNIPEPFNSGGIWKFDTGTGIWDEITPTGYSSAFGGISVDPTNPQRIIASTINVWRNQGGGANGDRFFISQDGGGTWRDIVEDGGIVRDPDGIPWMGTGSHSIHWAGSIEFDPYDPSRAFVVSGNGIFRTDDIDSSPVNWKFTVRGLEETVPLDMVSIPDGPLISVIGDYDGFVHHDVTVYPEIHQPQMGTTHGLAFAAQQSNIVVRSGSRLYRSQDTGETWTLMLRPNSVVNNGKVTLSADGNVLLWSPENSPNTFRTTDWGENWSTAEGITDNNAIPVADPVESDVFYIYNPAGGGRLLVSTDGGESFQEAGTPGGGGSRIIRAAPDREGDIWVARLNNGLWRSIDAGSSFERIDGVDGARSVGFGREAPEAEFPAVYIWGTIDGVTGIFRSIDEGDSWVRINDDDHQYGGPGNAQIITGDANIYGRVYMSTVGRGIVFGERDDEDEYTWGSVAMGGAGYVTGIITSAHEEGLIYARTDVGGAYRWKPEDESWIPLTDWIPEAQVGLMGIESLAIDPQNPNRMYMLAGTSYWSGGYTAILRSDDYGETFDVINVSNQFRAHGNGIGRQNGERLAVDPNNSDILWAGTRAHGLFRSTDRGDTWSRVISLDVTSTPNENGISFVVLDGTAVDDGVTQRIYVGVSTFDDDPTSVDDRGFVTSFALEQNYPNPFNPQTTITYALPGTDTVSLIVYDVIGRQVAVLVDNQIQTSGRHAAIFDAAHLPTGMYYYTLRTENFMDTKRMMLIK